MSRMTMNCPKCENCGTDARFQDMGFTRTLVYSPIIRDSDGNPVSGGNNTINHGVRCNGCKTIFTAKYSELHKAQNKPIEWVVSERLESSFWDSVKK